MTGEEATIVGAAVAGGASLIVFTANSIIAASRENRNRKRDVFATAFQACMAYKEFPYVVRRRRPNNSADERVRISGELRSIQERLSYYTAWMATESPDVARAYQRLVKETRGIAGGKIHEAWKLPPMERDDDMNMPDLGLGKLEPAEDAYLGAVRNELRFLRGGPVSESD